MSAGEAGPKSTRVRVVTSNPVLVTVPVVSTVRDSAHSKTQVEKRGGAIEGRNTAPAILPPKLRSYWLLAMGRAPRTNTALELLLLGPSMSKVRGRPVCVCVCVCVCMCACTCSQVFLF